MPDELINMAVIATEEGAVIAAEDGAVYVIPSDQLEQYRVPDEGAAQLHERLGLVGEVAGFSSPRLDLGALRLSGPVDVMKPGSGVGAVPMPGTLLEGLMDQEYRRR